MSAAGVGLKSVVRENAPALAVRLNTKALPEIYSLRWRGSWPSWLDRQQPLPPGHPPAGVMTQGGPSCDCGLRLPAAYRVLANALDSEGVGDVGLPPGATNIVG